MLVLAVVAAAYAPSLGGGFVWDDHAQVEHNPLLGDPVALVTSDIRGVLPIATTPFFGDGALDLTSADRLAD